MAEETLAFDAIVVGARIAGAISAILLAEDGHRVLVLERNRFPSDTLSTHFFRAPALRAFQQIGVLDQVHALAPRLVVDYNVVDGIVFPEPVDGPPDFPYYMCVRRISLDQVLVQRARRTPGLDLREGARVDGLLEEDGRVVGVTWSEPAGRQESRARVVIGADGVHSTVARHVRPAHEHTEPVNRAMYYTYLRGIPPHEGPAAEFHYRGDHLVYVFPCDDGLTLTAASVPISEFAQFRRDPDGRLWQELNAMTEVAPRLPHASRQGPVLGTGSIPGYLRVPYGPGWALVGDAGMVMDPWSGQGIDQAATHAVLLAGQLGKFLSGEIAWETAMNEYHRARNEFSYKTYQRTCTFGRDLRPMTRKALERRGLLPKQLGELS